jgi:hypothetical protein
MNSQNEEHRDGLEQTIRVHELILTWSSKMSPLVGDNVGGIKLVVTRLEGGFEPKPGCGI